MTMKSVYIVYITNCFLWTMSDNKIIIIIIIIIIFGHKTMKKGHSSGFIYK